MPYGSARITCSAAPVASVTFASRATLLSIVTDPWVRFGDAYSAGDVQIDGDLVWLLEAVYRAGGMGKKSPSILRRALALRHRNTLAGSRDNIHHHYDIGNDFYALWLGETMAYTCAYYPTPQATLDQAQIAKMDHVCRKLQLKAGERVVEAGCGWGVFALHMARNYGVRVRAYNISHEQIAYARERAAREGLGRQVEYVEDDYRSISGQYDAFVSIGMLEHVGVKNYETLGRIAHSSMGRCGRGLIHTDCRNSPARLQTVDREADLSLGRIRSAGAVGDGGDFSSPGSCRSSMSRNCGCTTRRRCATGSRATKPPSSACACCLTRSSCGCGGCIWPARWLRSRPARCSCSRCCSHRAATTTSPGRAPICTHPDLQPPRGPRRAQL